MSIRTHIFIDYENVQPPPEEFSRVPKADVYLWLLHGAHQHDFSAALVREWLLIGSRMKLLQSNKTGKNAVDVLLALHLGKVQEQERQAGRAARYLIVSKDNDFNALSPHLKQEGATLHRTPSLAAALESIKPVAKPRSSSTLRSGMLPEDVALVIENLAKHVKARPTRRARLAAHIGSLLTGKVTPAVSKSIIDELESRGVIAFDGTKVDYKLIG